MNLVEQIARMIDAEGAYGVAYGSTAENAKPLPQTTRQKYFQASYEVTAIRILKLLMGAGAEKIRGDLIEWEHHGWERFGIPSREFAEVVAAKYPLPEPQSNKPVKRLVKRPKTEGIAGY